METSFVMLQTFPCGGSLQTHTHIHVLCAIAMKTAGGSFSPYSTQQTSLAHESYFTPTPHLPFIGKCLRFS